MPNLLRRCVAEALGTFFLVLIGPGAAMVDAWSGGALGHVGVALSFGFVVTAMVYALGHISGAHINPAVTVAFASAHRFPRRDVLPYAGAQCAGAVVASLLSRLALGPVGHVGATLPAVPMWTAFAVEWVLSFGLMFVVMAVATDERVAGGFAGIAVGLTVGFEAMAGGPLTGASMNPARSLGPAVAGGGWSGHWLYWLAPLTAMIAAALVYDWLRPAGTPHVVPRTVPLGTTGPLEAGGGCCGA